MEPRKFPRPGTSANALRGLMAYRAERHFAAKRTAQTDWTKISAYRRDLAAQ